MHETNPNHPEQLIQRADPGWTDAQLRDLHGDITWRRAQRHRRRALRRRVLRASLRASLWTSGAVAAAVALVVLKPWAPGDRDDKSLPQAGTQEHGKTQYKTQYKTQDSDSLVYQRQVARALHVRVADPATVLTPKPTARFHDMALKSGEAVFTVRAPMPKPLRVRAADLVITDLGTTFTVTVNDGQVSVSVSEGLVRVQGPGVDVHLYEGGDVTSRAGASHPAKQRRRPYRDIHPRRPGGPHEPTSCRVWCKATPRA